MKPERDPNLHPKDTLNDTKETLNEAQNETLDT